MSCSDFVYDFDETEYHTTQATLTFIFKLKFESQFQAKNMHQILMLRFPNLNLQNGSGTWSPCFGSSLSYVDSSGRYGSPRPKVLEDMVLPSGEEIVYFAGEECSGGDCGFSGKEVEVAITLRDLW